MLRHSDPIDEEDIRAANVALAGSGESGPPNLDIHDVYHLDVSSEGNPVGTATTVVVDAYLRMVSLTDIAALHDNLNDRLGVNRFYRETSITRSVTGSAGYGPDEYEIKLLTFLVSSAGTEVEFVNGVQKAVGRKPEFDAMLRYEEVGGYHGALLVGSLADLDAARGHIPGFVGHAAAEDSELYYSTVRIVGEGYGRWLDRNRL